MRFPLDIVPNVPLRPHAGSFGAIRKYDIHTGVDLYAPDMTPVYAMTDGVVMDLGVFTGPEAGSEWWNTTWYIVVGPKEHSFGWTILYGEVYEPQHKKGDVIKEGEFLGYVKEVLKKDKGLPMSMLHVESYTKYVEPVWWKLNERKPDGLIDPTTILESCRERKI